uniref:Helicase C-terminal domain-containing protein n=1 Tax=Anopheles melas TaxID=34690 RepID=A0A182TWR5_9DIPT
MVQNVGQKTQISSTLAATIMKQLKHSKSLAGSSGDAAARSAEAAEMDERQRTEFYLACIEESRKERRREVLELLGRINAKRCDATPIYGRDLRETLCALIEEEFRHRPDKLIPFGVASSYHTRRATMARCGGGTKNGALFAAASSCLSEAIKSIDQRAGELRATISNFVLFVPAVCAPTPYLQVSHPHPSKLNAEQQWEATMAEQIQPAIQLLHPIISAMSTQFPDPRLIQYDCGKLQTLDRLLKKLKSEGHRVLIFTQMTRMLDVLEAFLNYHGHIYLRLDGTTKVEQRQVLMERFNNDRRMFAFILSTRSGGVGINLTGADTVIFYDSDWNPTMDAQAQDRCHRIGQTRDVHIYRLVSEKTIEENILKKANQKRILGDLAIEGGNFTTAYFKSSTTIQDLFTVDSAEQDASARLAEVLDRDRERKERLNANLATGPGQPQPATGGEPVADSSKSAINVFESALAAAEDDQDVQAAKFAKAEASADLDEFDETIPIDEEKVAAAGDAEGKEPELSKAEKEVQNLIKQLSPVERYAMRFVEDTEGTWTAVQLKAVEQEIEQQKRDWEANRLAEQRRNEEAARKREAEEHADLLTFSREDAKNQVNKTHPSNRVSSGGSSKHRLRTMRRNDRTSRVTTAKTMTDRDGGTLKNRANSRGHQVASKYDGGSRSGGRADGGQKPTTATGRRVMASAKQQPKHHSGGVGAKQSGLGNNKAAGSILGKRKYQESTVAKGGARTQSSKAAVAAAAANQRRAKGATRNAKHARRNVSKASVTDDEDEDVLESDESPNETVQDEDESNREENGSDSEAADSGDDGTEEEEEEEQDPLADIGTEDDRAKKQDDAVQDGENAAIIMLRNTPRRASVAARAVIGSMIQKTGVNVKQSPKAATTTNSGGSGGGGGSARAKITRQVPSPVRVAKSSINAAADRSAVSSASSSSASDAAAAAVTTASLAKPLDEFDSECSLDVMVDSNDAPDSDSNQMNSYYNSGNSAGSGMHHDEDARAGGTVDGGGGGGGSSTKDHQSSRPTSRVGRARDGRSRTPVVSSTSPMVVPASCDLSVDETSDDVDESSNASKTTPRTRSRGTVKINLWTLDDSPMLPVYNRRPNRSKTPQLSQQPNHHHQHLGDDGGDTEERESAEISKKDASSSAVESISSKPAEANECNSSSSSTAVDNHRDHLNHSSNSPAAPHPPATTNEQQQPQKTVANSIVPKTTNVIRNLKVVVNDLLRTPDTAKRVSEVSDGFRAPTPTNTKLRRLKRLSRGVGSAGGRATPPIVMNAGGATYNRTLDGWLTKAGTTGTGRKEEVDAGSENHRSGGADRKLPGGEEGSASKLASTVARSQQHEEKDPLENGNV